jgi:hypothetical protein
VRVPRTKLARAGTAVGVKGGETPPLRDHKVTPPLRDDTRKSAWALT